MYNLTYETFNSLKLYFVFQRKKRYLVPLSLLFHCHCCSTVIAVQLSFLFNCHCCSTVIAVQLSLLFNCHCCSTVIAVQLLAEYSRSWPTYQFVDILDKPIEIYIFKEVLFKMWTSYRNQRQVFKVGFHSIHVICTYFFAIK